MVDSQVKLRLIITLLFTILLFSLIYIICLSFSEEIEEPIVISPFKTTWGVMGKEEADQTIFRPNGFWLREPGTIPALEYLDLPNCSLVFADWYNRAKNHNPDKPAPTKIPTLLKNRFTANGMIEFIEDVDDEKVQQSPITWTRDQIEELILKDVTTFDYYKGQERALYRAMENNDINGATMYVFGGTQTPWVEAFALKEGVLEITRTASVNISIENYPYVLYKNPFEIARNYHNYLNRYDFAVSFSVEDFGFGKHDALNPFGDLLEIQKAYCMLKDNGILLLGLPIGWDAVLWNSKRVYGRLRIAMLASAFDIVDMFYYDDSVSIEAQYFDEMEPGKHRLIVLVLKKRHTTEDWF